MASLCSGTAGEWEKLPQLPSPNGGFVAAVVQGQVLVAGGTNWEGGVKSWLNAVHGFSLRDEQWRLLGRLTSPMAYAVSGVVNDANGPKLFIMGGSTGARALGEVGVLSPSGAHQIMGKLEKPVVLAAGGVLEGWLIQVGGTDDAGNLAGLRRTALAYRLSDGRVERLPDYPGEAFGTAASAVSGDELFVFGGANWDARSGQVCNTDEAFALHLATRTWRRLRKLPFVVRGLAAVAVGQDAIYLAGGYRGDAVGFTDEAHIYDIALDQFRAAPALPYPGMVGLLTDGEHMYCLGGEDRQKSRTNAFHRRELSDFETTAKKKTK